MLMYKKFDVIISKPNNFYANDSSIFISSRHAIANSIMYMAYFMCFKLVYGYE